MLVSNPGWQRAPGMSGSGTNVEPMIPWSRAEHKRKVRSFQELVSWLPLPVFKGSREIPDELMVITKNNPPAEGRGVAWILRSRGRG